ncbi:MAG: hypothetical protein BGO01_20775 [Armatimonadetes bacterium 55-13]|nr:hypothetical protein [Armatimonadota bacterium]OJU64547.1 MAG: hypothetical protein BGO01_20775 [Armatimonadetes bacterium 55-13]
MFAETVRLARWAEGDLPGSRRLVRFSMEIYWLRESETHFAYYWDGRIFRESSTTNDFYGFLTSPTVEVYERTVNLFSLTATDRLEYRATTIISEYPVQLIKAEPGKKSLVKTFSSDIFLGSEDDYVRIENYDYDKGEPDWVPGDVLLKPRTVDEVVTFSSKRSEEENDRSLSDLRARWMEVVR